MAWLALAHSLPAGSPETELKVEGRALVDGDVVLIDGEPVATTFVAGDELRATLPAEKLATAAKLKVLARRPGAKPVQSNELELEVA